MRYVEWEKAVFSTGWFLCVTSCACVCVCGRACAAGALFSALFSGRHETRRPLPFSHARHTRTRPNRNKSPTACTYIRSLLPSFEFLVVSRFLFSNQPPSRHVSRTRVMPYARKMNSCRAFPAWSRLGSSTSTAPSPSCRGMARRRRRRRPQRCPRPPPAAPSSTTLSRTPAR